MARFTPPTVETVAAYAGALGYTDFDAGEFVDYYSEVGWLVGKTRKPMACWQAAVRQWQRRQREWGAADKAHPVPDARRRRLKLRADWDAALGETVLAVWPHHKDRVQVGRMLRAARDKYADLGRNQDGETVSDAALRVIRDREESGWGGE